MHDLSVLKFFKCFIGFYVNHAEVVFNLKLVWNNLLPISILDIVYTELFEHGTLGSIGLFICVQFLIFLSCAQLFENPAKLAAAFLARLPVCRWNFFDAAKWSSIVKLETNINQQVTHLFKLQQYYLYWCSRWVLWYLPYSSSAWCHPPLHNCRWRTISCGGASWHQESYLFRHN